LLITCSYIYLLTYLLTYFKFDRIRTVIQQDNRPVRGCRSCICG